MYVLIDCNNFFVSCERVFRPELEDKPVAVLSNNDGCFVARSNEVKALGIPMGAPVFKWKESIRKHDIHLFSGNFKLYMDMSKRIMSLLSEFTPDMEVYSIDECFLTYTSVPTGYDSYHDFGHYIRHYILRCTGVPVSVGFAATKTLSKLANHVAKRTQQGVCDLADYDSDDILKTIEVRDIWGVGRKSSAFLNGRGIHTAFQLKYAPEKCVKHSMHLPGLQTQLELQGIPCIKLDTYLKPNKSILSSRSFGTPIRNIEELKGGITANITVGASKLRQQGSVASGLTVFIKTNRFKSEYKKESVSITLPQATSSTRVLLAFALKALEGIVEENTTYIKSGIMLVNFSREDSFQYNLFIRDIEKEEKEKALMKSLDNINMKWGRNTVSFSRLKNKKKPWESKCAKPSSEYTSNWNELLQVRC